MVSIMTGEVKSSLFNTGSLSISSSLAYLDLSSVFEPSIVDFGPLEENGNVVAAMPPTIAVEINLRRLIFISNSFLEYNCFKIEKIHVVRTG